MTDEYDEEGSPSVAGGLFGALRQVAAPFVGELIDRAAESLPPCECCARKAIPIRCQLCGGYFCVHHGYVSAGRGEMICRPCHLALLGDAAGVDEFDLSPWEVLDIPEGASRAQVERAFRIKARACHPDRHPDDPEKAQQFRRLQWAHETALEMVRAAQATQSSTD